MTTSLVIRNTKISEGQGKMHFRIKILTSTNFLTIRYVTSYSPTAYVPIYLRFGATEQFGM